MCLLHLAKKDGVKDTADVFQVKNIDAAEKLKILHDALDNRVGNTNQKPFFYFASL